MWPVLFALLPIACSRPADTAQADQHRVPFKEGENATGDSRLQQSSTAENEKLRPDRNLPFRDSQSLPAGTLVTVRLKNPIAADNPGFSGVFDAVVDEAVLVEGNELLPRGASVAGRVESARASGLHRNRGYVRLTLDSLNIAGRELPIQTASLFVRGNISATQVSEGISSPQVVRLESGRRLTFRLAEAVPIASPPDSPLH